MLVFSLTTYALIKIFDGRSYPDPKPEEKSLVYTADSMDSIALRRARAEAVVTSFIHHLYSGDSRLPRIFDDIQELAFQDSTLYWCNFIAERWMVKTPRAENWSWIYAGDSVTDDQTIRALIKEGFSPDPAKLKMSANGEYIWTHDAEVALMLYLSYHSYPPLPDRAIRPNALSREILDAPY